MPVLGSKRPGFTLYLQIHRDIVHATLRRWITEGIAGLDDKSSAPRHAVRKTDLTAMRTVKERRCARKAKQAQAIYAALGIAKQEIERWQPWQNYIETNFIVQQRMADWDFAQATTWTELLEIHDQWVVNFNYQSHWAHQEREDGRRSPAKILGWVSGREISTEELHRVFYRTRFGRKLDKLGYIRFRHWRVYGEQGLAKEHVAVWLYGETLTVEFADEPLARYRVRYQPDKRHLCVVKELQVFETAFRWAQLSLWD